MDLESHIWTYNVVREGAGGNFTLERLLNQFANSDPRDQSQPGRASAASRKRRTGTGFVGGYGKHTGDSDPSSSKDDSRRGVIESRAVSRPPVNSNGVYRVSKPDSIGDE